MKLLTYDEALEKAENKEWFKNFYSREEVCLDEEVKEANELAASIGPNVLEDYFKQNQDMLLLGMYYDSLMDYLEDLKYNFVKPTKKTLD